jgi:2'-5' RNA ligase
MPGMLRVFVAVEIPGPVRSALGSVQDELRQGRVRARWVRPDNIHLTLKFLGAIPVGHVASIAGAMQATAAAHPRFGLSVAGIGVFPGLRRPRVLWAGIAGRAAPLANLHQDLDRRLAALGFPREGRPFRGHLTIARFGVTPAAGLSAAVLAGYRDAPFGDLEVRETVLFQSELKPDGPVYTALARAALKT